MNLPPAPLDRPYVLKLPGVGPRPVAREVVRARLRATLQRWHGRPIGLIETTRGPQPEPTSAARDLQVSLTYAGEDAWIAFHHGPIGLDACLAREFAERAEVTRVYLAAGNADDEDVAGFARRWARHEAALKYHGRGLAEGGAVPRPPRLRDWAEGDVALALAWG
jgi:phosphopantetheinyl transferase